MWKNKCFLFYSILFYLYGNLSQILDGATTQNGLNTDQNVLHLEQIALTTTNVQQQQREGNSTVRSFTGCSVQHLDASH